MEFCWIVKEFFTRPTVVVLQCYHNDRVLRTRDVQKVSSTMVQRDEEWGIYWVPEKYLTTSNRQILFQIVLLCKLLQREPFIFDSVHSKMLNVTSFILITSKYIVFYFPIPGNLYYMI